MHGMRFLVYAYFIYDRYAATMYAYFEKFHDINPDYYAIWPFTDDNGTCKTLIIPSTRGMDDPRPKDVHQKLKDAGWRRKKFR